MKTKILLSTLLIAGSVCSASAAMMMPPLQPEVPRVRTVADSLPQEFTRDDIAEYEHAFKEQYINPIFQGRQAAVKKSIANEVVKDEFLQKLIEPLQREFSKEGELEITVGDIRPYIGDGGMAGSFVDTYWPLLEFTVLSNTFFIGTKTSCAILELIGLAKKSPAGKDAILQGIRADRYVKGQEVRVEANRLVDEYLDRVKPFDELLKYVFNALLGNDEFLSKIELKKADSRIRGLFGFEGERAEAPARQGGDEAPAGLGALRNLARDADDLLED